MIRSIEVWIMLKMEDVEIYDMLPSLSGKVASKRYWYD